MENFNISLGNISLYIYKWKVEEGREKRGIVQIVHGVSEHMGRYDEFAKFLNDYGFEVWGHDHPGHGMTSGRHGSCPSDAMSTLLGGMAEVREEIRRNEPELPLILFGHSMGSFLALRTVELYPDTYDAVILSGTSGKLNPVVIAAAEGLGNILLKRRTENNRFDLHKMLFKMYNSKIKNTRTRFDWINSIPDEVDKYIADPDCGFKMDNDFIHSLINGISVYYKNSEVSKIRKNIPVLLISGTNDPLGDMGKGIIRLAKQLKAVGLKEIYLRLYEGSRHEILHDRSKKDVMNDILEFIENVKGV